MNDLVAALHPSVLDMECLIEPVTDHDKILWEGLGIPPARIEFACDHTARMRWAWLMCRYDELVELLRERGLPPSARNLVFWASPSGIVGIAPIFYLRWEPREVVVVDPMPLPLPCDILPNETVSFRTELR